MAERLALGLDIGGTFTDFVLLNETTGDLRVHKRLTTYPDASGAVLEGIAELLPGGAEPGPPDLRLLVHSTTLVTNAIIERRGPPTGLLATTGHVDTLDLGNEQRYDGYDLFLAYPEPLVPRQLRREIGARLTRDGDELAALAPGEVEAAVAELVERGVRALAIAFLHAYRDGRHERAARAAIEARWPELPVSLSSEVAPLIGEWERTSTTVADAYVKPLVDAYLARLERRLDELGYRHPLLLTLSGGGTGTARSARERPIRLIESGPGAGVLAAAFYGRLIGRPDLLSFDMGGTTAKACLIEGGQPALTSQLEAARVHRFKRGSGLPIVVPALELIEIGAGGGSIARIDELGLLKVGPESAAADPGPAAYARGGSEPTVTDADLLLGYYNPDYFLGGAMRLDVAAAERAVAALAGRLGLDPVETAWGIHQVVNEQMAQAARIHIIERGHDPRRFALLAFGGAGPCHAPGVARLLGAREVILPLAAGATSALGCIAAPLAFQHFRTRVARLDALDWAELRRLYAQMREEGAAALAQAGVAPELMRFHASADMRLAGQYHEIRVPLPLQPSGEAGDEVREGGGGAHGWPGQLGPALLPELEAAFDRLYRERYRRRPAGIPAEAVNWHLVASGPPAQVELRRYESGGGRSAEVALKGRRRAYFPLTSGAATGGRPGARGFVETPIYDRYALRPGMELVGPAIVEERESTAVIAPGDAARVDEYLNLIVTLGGGA